MNFEMQKSKEKRRKILTHNSDTFYKPPTYQKWN